MPPIIRNRFNGHFLGLSGLATSSPTFEDWWSGIFTERKHLLTTKRKVSKLQSTERVNTISNE